MGSAEDDDGAIYRIKAETIACRSMHMLKRRSIRPEVSTLTADRRRTDELTDVLGQDDRVRREQNLTRSGDEKLPVTF